MRKIVLVFLSMLGWLWSGYIQQATWPEHYPFATYAQENNMSDLMRSITLEDMQHVEAIQSGEKYYELRDRGRLLQSLIPIGEEMQIQITTDSTGKHLFDIVPIVYRTHDEAVSFAIEQGFAQQIEHHTGSAKLGLKLGRLFANEKLFRSLRPSDRVAFVYTQKEHMGRPVGSPRIHGALIAARGKEYFVYVDPKGTIHHGTSRTEHYTETEKRPFTYTTVHKLPSARFRMPLDRVRITSKFSYRRWHPILKKYRPHFGVDFGAKRGTPLKALNSGRIVFAGWMRGYGKVTKINHGGGFVSLYAHQSNIRVKVGQRVRRGQIIGKVGSTGRSTGPHLHLGLYLRGKPVNPLKYIARKGTGKTRTVTKKHTVMKDYPVAKTRQVAIPGARKLQRTLRALIATPPRDTYRWRRSDRLSIPAHSIETDRTPNKEARHG